MGSTAGAPGPLAGLRVVDVGVHVAGPLLGMLLADAGAEVVHIGRPGRAPQPSDAVLHRSKHCIELDLTSPAGLADARQLVAAADIVVENFRPGVMDRLGLGAADSLAANPRLIYGSLPGFPSGDPRAHLRGWEQTVSAATSIYRPPRAHGPAGPELGAAPAILPIPLLSTYAAIIGAGAVVAALIARERDGRGQHVVSALSDAAIEIIGHEFAQTSLGPGSGFKPPTRAGTGHYRGSDGRWLHFCLFDDRHLLWFGRRYAPELAADGWFDGDRLRGDPERAAELPNRLAALIATRPAADWERDINELTGAPAAICQSQSDWLLLDDHARSSGAVVALADPLSGDTHQLGTPVTLGRTSLRPRPRTFGAAPSWPPREASTATAVTAPPLEGITVVDVTQVLAGPTCGRVLAEYGADVIKINKPADRAIPWHAWVNRGKRSILLDIGAPAARPIVERLIAGADVVSQNFALGVADRLGIGEREVRRLNPDVVYASITAFGPAGFRAAWRGREELGQAVTGLQSLWADDRGDPQMYLFPVTDIGTGHLAAFGVMLALFHRARTGEGQSVHASLAQTATAIQASHMIEFAGRVWDLPRGQHIRSLGPSDQLCVGRDGRWFSVVTEGGVTVGERDFADTPAMEAVERLLAAGHTAHLVTTGAEVQFDPVALARGITTADNVGVTRRLTASTLPGLRPATTPGIDGREVIESLGFADRWDALVANGVVVGTAADEHQGRER